MCDHNLKTIGTTRPFWLHGGNDRIVPIVHLKSAEALKVEAEALNNKTKLNTK